MKDVLKLLIAFLLYGGFAPLLGVCLTGRRTAQRIVFGLMILMTGWRPGHFTFMIGSVETYRGHTKGFEISLIEVLALALIVAVLRASRSSLNGGLVGRPSVPGLKLYFFWCSLAMFSVLGSAEPSYAWMAAFRFFKAGLIFAAAALYIRDDNDISWAVGAIGVALLHHGLLALKLRVFDGDYQVKGWFEHQNPMAMWCYLGAISLLGFLLHSRVKGLVFWLCLSGYLGATLAILVSVSRASLAALAVGSISLFALALFRGFNRRIAGALVAGVLGIGVVSLFALDSFKARMAQVSQSEEEVDEDLRDILNRQSAAMLRDEPFNGVGWNNFGIMNSRPRGVKYSEVLENWDEDRGFTVYEENYLANPLTESLYWLWLAETGWLGFSGFILFLGASLMWPLCAALRLRGSIGGALAVALLVALSICYAHGLVERILTQTKNLSQWMILVGMGSGLLSYASAPKVRLN